MSIVKKSQEDEIILPVRVRGVVLNKIIMGSLIGQCDYAPICHSCEGRNPAS